ncbi:hypothetical protein ACOSQ2_020754 [Xanthoceras sorbifolium]
MHQATLAHRASHQILDDQVVMPSQTLNTHKTWGEGAASHPGGRRGGRTSSQKLPHPKFLKFQKYDRMRRASSLKFGGRRSRVLPEEMCWEEGAPPS